MAITDICTVVTDFFIATDTDANGMIERAFASTPTYKNVVLPAGEYVIVRPIVVPDGVSFRGVGGESVLKPDFSKWEQTLVNGVMVNDYRVVVIHGREGINSIYNSFNTIHGDFSISALNGNLVKAIGLFIGTDQVITWEQSVCYSLFNAIVQNIYIENLDTAYYVQEAWNTNFINIQCMYCRDGLDLVGKSVNCNFMCNFQNFNNLNTTVAFNNLCPATYTCGINIEQKTTYSDGNGRPEGICILPGTLVFGAHNNLIIEHVLNIDVADCILDGALKECIIVNLPDGVTIHNNYIASKAKYADGISCISLLGNQTSAWSKNTIRNNEIVGIGGGGYQAITANSRWDLDVCENDIQGFGTVATDIIIYLNNCHSYKILNNHGHSNIGIFIYNQTDGEFSSIDGNTSEDNYKILQCQPSTDMGLQIGRNFSANSATYAHGKILLLANTTSVSITPFGAITNADFVYPLITFNCYNDWLTSHQITWKQNNNVVTFFSDIPIGSNSSLYYEISAIPCSAF